MSLQNLTIAFEISFARVDFIFLSLLALCVKLDIFIVIQQILLMFFKWSSLQKSVSKFMPKEFYEIKPRFTLQLERSTQRLDKY